MNHSLVATRKFPRDIKPPDQKAPNPGAKVGGAAASVPAGAAAQGRPQLGLSLTLTAGPGPAIVSGLRGGTPPLYGETLGVQSQTPRGTHMLPPAGSGRA